MSDSDENSETQQELLGHQGRASTPSRRRRKSRQSRAAHLDPLPGELPDRFRGDWVLSLSIHDGNRHDQDTLLSRLLGARLEVSTEGYGDEILVHVSGSESRLEEEAERISLQKRLRKKGAGRKEPDQFRPYVRWRRDEFQKGDMFVKEKDAEALFSSAERALLVESIMEAKMEDGGAEIVPDGVEKESAVLEKKAGLVKAFPTHYPPEVRRLAASWGSFNPFKSRSITELRDYAGEHVAFYFSYLAFYTRWLFFPAIIGAAIFFAQIHAGGPNKTNLTMLWSFIVVLWATFFLENWRRAEKNLAFKWDALDVEETEKPRPQFVGVETTAGSTGVKVMDFSSSKRAWRVLMGWIVVGLCSMGCIGVYVTYLHAIVNYNSLLGTRGVVLASLLNTVTIIAFSAIYRKIATALNDWENYKTETEYLDAITPKFFIFEFINNYFMLFYITFLKQGILFDDSKCNNNDCMSELQIQLSILFVTKTTVQQFMETAVPMVGRLVTSGTKKQESGVHLERDKPDYPGTFDEFNEMVLQLGFIMIFAPAFPLAAFVAFINNFIELRTDALKMLFALQRPRFRRAEDIGPWFQLLSVIVVVAIVTNSAITCFVSDQLAQNGWLNDGLKSPAARWGSAKHWTLAVLMEHVLLIARFAVAWLVPDLPDRVKLELEVRKQTNKEFAATEESRKGQRDARASVEKRMGERSSEARELVERAVAEAEREGAGGAV